MRKIGLFPSQESEGVRSSEHSARGSPGPQGCHTTSPAGAAGRPRDRAGGLRRPIRWRDTSLVRLFQTDQICITPPRWGGEGATATARNKSLSSTHFVSRRRRAPGRVTLAPLPLILELLIMGASIFRWCRGKTGVLINTACSKEGDGFLGVVKSHASCR